MLPLHTVVLNKYVAFLRASWTDGIEVSDRRLTDGDFRAVREAIQTGATSIDIYNVSFSEGYFEGFCSLMAALQGNVLEDVRFCGTALQQSDVLHISGAFRDSKHLQKLEFVACDVDGWGVTHLAGNLPRYPSLREFSLVRSRGDIDWYELFRALPLEQLERLTLSHHSFGPHTVAMLARELGKRGAPELQTLVLNDVDMCDEGLDALAQALPSCPKIKCLLMSSNNLGQGSLDALGKVLQQCPTLQQLGLFRNRFTDLEALATIVRNHPTLTWFNARRNEMDDEAIERFTKAAPLTNLHLGSS